MTRAFVTGASGFLGQRLVAVLRAGGAQVSGLGRSDKARAAIAAAGGTPVAGDLDDEAALAAALAGHDVVYHAAAVTDLGVGKGEFMRVNVDGTRRLCAAARAAGVRRVVHVSTEAVLVGRGPLVRADETRPRLPRPPGLYPLTKALAEDEVQAAVREGLDAVICRPRFIWGAGDTTLLPRLLEVMRAGKWAWMAGGRPLTSTCHVDNVCEGLLAAAERGRRGEVYFLTDGDPISFREMLTALVATQGVTPSSRSVPSWVAFAAGAVTEAFWKVAGKKGEPPVHRTAVRLMGQEMTLDDSKARRELGYVGRVTRAEGLAAMRST